jgi:hypothetical protein
MRVKRIGVPAVLTLASALAGLSQSSNRVQIDPSARSSPQDPAAQPSPQAPAESAPSAAQFTRRGRQTPCWRIVGIAPEAVNQRWHIEDKAKGQIGAVCTDPSLAPEKKRDRIHEINQETEQEIAKIIPANQLAAFKQCEEKRKSPKTSGEKEVGPCGGIIPTQHSHNPQPNKPPNP